MFTKLTVEAELLGQLPSRLTTRTEPCPSGRGALPWLFSPPEAVDSREITKQSQ